MKKLLGLDIGTSSIKASVFDETFQELASCAISYSLYFPQEGWAEIEKDVLWQSVLSCIRTLQGKIGLADVVAVGIDTLCPGLTALDENLKPLINPILYCDHRSKDEETEILSRVGEERLFKITANHVMSGAISATSMLWIKKHRPEIYANTRYFGHINTMLSALLTGHAAIDPSNASYTGLFETTGGCRWSKELCQLIGIDEEKLPPVLASASVSGIIHHPLAIAAGIPAGTPLIIGGSDTTCTAVACGAIHAGDVFESIGTTDVLTICVEKPIFCREYINRYHVYPNRWIYQGAMSNAGFAQKWAIKTLCKDWALQSQEAQESTNYQAYDREVMSSQPGASGVVFLPYLTGERCPIWNPDAKGVFFGLSEHTTRSDMIRAVAESSAYATRNLIEIYERQTGNHFQTIHAVGGGTRSAALMQLKADITEKEIDVLKNNSAAMGAAILASVGAGLYRCIDEAVEKSVKQTVVSSYNPSSSSQDLTVYKSRFETFLALYQSVKHLFS